MSCKSVISTPSGVVGDGRLKTKRVGGAALTRFWMIDEEK
jgi:ribosomal protein S8